MKVFIGYRAFPMFQGWNVEKVFNSEEDAKAWAAEENSKVLVQIYDDYGLVEGVEFNYFEKVVE